MRAVSRRRKSNPGARAIRRIWRRWSRACPIQNDQSGAKLKFLRRIPVDPMTKSTEWGMRAYQDKPDARTWGRGNVFDVYSKSSGTALDGSLYKDW